MLAFPTWPGGRHSAAQVRLLRGMPASYWNAGSRPGCSTVIQLPANVRGKAAHDDPGA